MLHGCEVIKRGRWRGKGRGMIPLATRREIVPGTSPFLSVTHDAHAIIYPVNSVKWIVSLLEMVGCRLNATLAIFFI